tara:strand:+ start:13824 stop:14249 length:426 start_codon:yes stop_codon:yes gene_type:complete
MVVLPPPTFFSWWLDISQQLSAHLDFVVRLPSMFDMDAFLFFADFTYCSAISRAMTVHLESVAIASLYLFMPRTSSHAKWNIILTNVTQAHVVIQGSLECRVLATMNYILLSGDNNKQHVFQFRQVRVVGNRYVHCFPSIL